MCSHRCLGFGDGAVGFVLRNSRASIRSHAAGASTYARCHTEKHSNAHRMAPPVVAAPPTLGRKVSMSTPFETNGALGLENNARQLDPIRFGAATLSWQRPRRPPHRGD